MTRLELATKEDLAKKRDLLEIKMYEWGMVRKFIAEKKYKLLVESQEKSYRNSTEAKLILRKNIHFIIPIILS